MTESRINPMGTDGIEFIEFAAPEPAQADKLFRSLGFAPVACHRSKDVTLYRQGGINFILNSEPQSFSQSFARVHGPSVCAVALRVKNARTALERAGRLGAEVVPVTAGPMELNIPAIRAVGGSLLYLVDRYEGRPGQVTIYDIDFVPIAGADALADGFGLVAVDRLVQTVHRGRSSVWTDFFGRLFNFSADRGALISACGRIRVEIREPAGEHDAAEGFLDAYHGEGIQQIVLAAGDLAAAAERLRRDRTPFSGGSEPGEPVVPDQGIGPVSFALVQGG